MAEVLDVMDALSTPLKVGWVVWSGWAVGQVYWYRYERGVPIEGPTAPRISHRRMAITDDVTSDMGGPVVATLAAEVDAPRAPQDASLSPAGRPSSGRVRPAPEATGCSWVER